MSTCAPRHEALYICVSICLLTVSFHVGMFFTGGRCYPWLAFTVAVLCGRVWYVRNLSIRVLFVLVSSVRALSVSILSMCVVFAVSCVFASCSCSECFCSCCYCYNSCILHQILVTTTIAKYRIFVLLSKKLFFIEAVFSKLRPAQTI